MSDLELVSMLVPEAVQREVRRQLDKWGHANDFIPDDRWMEIAEDEFRDLKWAVRTCNEVDGHTVNKEMCQLLAVLLRWAEARA